MHRSPGVSHEVVGLVDELADPDRLVHRAEPDWVVVARRFGLVVRGLCGFRRVPLGKAELDGLEACPTCAALAGVIDDARRDRGHV